MSKAQEIAEYYFALSNKSDFTGIRQLLTDTTTYNSQNTGLYIGAQAIITMQQAFHASFSFLHWNIESISEADPGVVVIEYSFTATKQNGQKLQSSGIEQIVSSDGKIQHIEIRNM